MCNDKKEGGRAFLDDHHRNDLDNTDTRIQLISPPHDCTSARINLEIQVVGLCANMFAQSFY